MSTELVERQEQTTTLGSPETAAEMRVRLQEMRQKVSLVQSFFKEIMRPNEDYGTIPGTEKPTLLKPGAEKLCEFYGYSIHVDTEREEKDRATGWYDCAVKVTLISRRTGEVIAEGVGEANTYEARYRYRWVWPEQVPSDLDKSNLPTRKTRNGKVQYRLENDDLFTLWNTVKKMAKKRALIDATLSATRSSGLFTQDMEDLQEWANAGDVIEGEYEVRSVDGQPDRSPTRSKASQRLTQAQVRERVKALRDRWQVAGLDDEAAKALWIRATGKQSMTEGVSAKDLDAFETLLAEYEPDGIDDLDGGQQEQQAETVPA